MRAALSNVTPSLANAGAVSATDIKPASSTAGACPRVLRMPVPRVEVPRTLRNTPCGRKLECPLKTPTAMAARTTAEFTLDPPDAERLANLNGPFDGHLRMIELRTGVEVASRGNVYRLTGPKAMVRKTEALLRGLWDDAAGDALDEPAVHLALAAIDADALVNDDIEPQEVTIRVKRGTIRGRGANQAKYLHAIATHDINFGIGPAGTGKTFLAVASAVEALNESRVQRLVLVRPAVEAGEKLGFLPGDLTQKVDPYLRPLYDALYEML